MDSSDWPFLDEHPPERRERQHQIVGSLPFFKLIGLQLEETATDYAKLSLEFRPDLTQPAGILHGGIHATLVDTAVAQALVTTLKPNVAIVTIDMDVKYFKPVAKGRVYAEARIIRKGKKIAHGDVDLRDDQGALVGKGWCVYALLPQEGGNPATR